MAVLVKECSHCHVNKSAKEFNKSSKSKTGLQSWCKVCTKDWGKKRTKSLRRARRRKKNGTLPLHLPRNLHLLLDFCAESEGATVDSYCERVLRRHIKDHVLDDLVNI